MDEANLREIREALDMPEATVSDICERIRTLRQVEISANFLAVKLAAARRRGVVL
jgi:hypothetical protein